MSFVESETGSFTFLAPLRSFPSTSRGTAVKPCSRIPASLSEDIGVESGRSGMEV